MKCSSFAIELLPAEFTNGERKRESRRVTRVCECGAAATRLCDYKIGLHKRCDAMVCDKCGGCGTKRDQDLCGFHTRYLEQRVATRILVAKAKAIALKGAGNARAA